MSINILESTPIPISKVPAWVLEHCGFKPNRSTVFRWTKRGSNGRILATVKAGGRRITTVEALLEFFDEGSGHAGNAPERTARSDQEAAAFLEAEGI